MIALPKQWCDFLVRQPETGMGYTIVTVTTMTGRHFPQVVVDSGYISRVRGYDAVPFCADEIADIAITHDKWDWSADRPAR